MPATKKNRARLDEIVIEFDMTARDVAQLLNRSESTVQSWMVPDTGRDIPDHTLELLEYKLGLVG